MTVQNTVAPPHMSASIDDPLSRVRSHSVSTTYLRQGTAGTQYCDYCVKKLTSKTSLILHIRTAHNTDFDDKLGGRQKQKLSTFSFRSRASSLSSSSSSSSRSTTSSSTSSHSSINTELFWNKYRRKPEDSFVTNMIRRAVAGRLFYREKKYSSSIDLHCNVVQN